MDRISESNVITLVAILIFSFFLLPILFSFLIWIKGRKVSLVSYVINVLLAIIIFFINIQIVFSSTITQISIIKIMPYARMLSIIGFALIIVSIILNYKKYKTLGNISLNLSTGMGLILFLYLLLNRY